MQLGPLALTLPTNHLQLFTGKAPWEGKSVSELIRLVTADRAVLDFGAESSDPLVRDYVQLSRACMSYEAESRPPMPQVLSQVIALSRAAHGSP